MLQLSKRQIKALLDVISNDDTRPVLQHAYIDRYKEAPTLVATDGYKLVALKLEESARVHIGKAVSRAEIVKWYKLATGKDYFTTDTVIELAGKLEGDYPKWQNLLPKETCRPTAVSFNAEYALTLSHVKNDPANKYGSAGVAFRFGGEREDAPMMIDDLTDNLYLLMTMKR